MTKWLAYILLFAIAGFCREYLFVNYNRMLYYVYYPQIERQELPAFLTLFDGFTYAQLYYLKYPFTLAWTAFFFLLSHYAIKHLGHTSYLLKILRWTYVALLAIAMLSMVFGWLVNNRLDQDEYTLSRWLMGIAQSPIICLFLLASEKLIPKQHSI